jgi:hypothetical protein
VPRYDAQPSVLSPQHKFGTEFRSDADKRAHRNTEMDGAYDRLHGGEPSFSSSGLYHLTLLALSFYCLIALPIGDRRAENPILPLLPFLITCDLPLKIACETVCARSRWT